MKYIKKYNELNFSSINESGIPREETQGIENEIKNMLAEEDLFVSVSGEKSKYGTIIDVSFSSDYPIVADDRMNRWSDYLMEINDLISKHFNSKATLCGFKFFGKEVIGQKDGRTLEVEDVTTKFDELFDQDFSNSTDIRITFRFLVK